MQKDERANSNFLIETHTGEKYMLNSTCTLFLSVDRDNLVVVLNNTDKENPKNIIRITSVNADAFENFLASKNFSFSSHKELVYFLKLIRKLNVLGVLVRL